MLQSAGEYLTSGVQATFDGPHRDAFYFTDLTERIIIKIKPPQYAAVRHFKLTKSRMHCFASFLLDELVQRRFGRFGRVRGGGVRVDQMLSATFCDALDSQSAGDRLHPTTDTIGVPERAERV